MVVYIDSQVALLVSLSGLDTVVDLQGRQRLPVKADLALYVVGVS